MHAVHKVGHPNLDQIAMPTTQAQTIAPHWEESTVCNRPAPLAVHFRPADTGGLCLFIYSDSCTSIYCCTSSMCSLHSRSVIVLFIATWAARKSPIPMSDECDSWTHKARRAWRGSRGSHALAAYSQCSSQCIGGPHHPAARGYHTSTCLMMCVCVKAPHI